MANLKHHKVVDFKYFTEGNGIKNDYICFCSYAYLCKVNLNVVFLQNISSYASFYKGIHILLQYSLLCKTDSKNLVILTQRSKLNEFVLLCKGKKQLSLKVRSILFPL